MHLEITMGDIGLTTKVLDRLIIHQDPLRTSCLDQDQDQCLGLYPIKTHSEEDLVRMALLCEDLTEWRELKDI